MKLLLRNPKHPFTKLARMEPMAEGISPLRAWNKRCWKTLTDDEMVKYAQHYVKINNIKSATEFQDLNSTVYGVLSKRGLFEKVEFEGGNRRWGTDEKMLEAARMIIVEKSIRNRCGLEKADSRLYRALRRRNLLEKIGFDKWNRKWGTDEELLETARKFIQEKGITKPSGLETADESLYQILRIRQLLEKLNFNDRKREFGPDGEVLEIARKTIEKNAVMNRMGLFNADSGLYRVLWRRKLLDQAFTPIKQSNHKEAVDGVIEALGSFGDDK